MLLSSFMWSISSCGSPSSDTRSTQCCSSRFRLSPELEEQLMDPEQIVWSLIGLSTSIFSSLLEQHGPFPPSLQWQRSSCSTSRASMLSEMSLTLGGGFSKALLMSSMIWLSCSVTRCRRSVTEVGTGFSGCWIWHQHHTALWEETQRERGCSEKTREDRKAQSKNRRNKGSPDVSAQKGCLSGRNNREVMKLLEDQMTLIRQWRSKLLCFVYNQLEN